VQAPVALPGHDAAPPGGVNGEEGEKLGGFESGGQQKVVHRRCELQLVELDEPPLGMHGREERGD
jgi:hypothetical protein